MHKRFFCFTFILIMMCLVLGGCITGAGGNNNDNSAVSGSGSRISDGKLTVHFLDVGQGDSIFIQIPSGQNVLIDGGERNQGEKITGYLEEQGISKLDILIGTHPHSDHIGGLIDVLRNFKVEKIYLPKVTHTTATFRDLLTAVKSQGLKVSTARAGVEIPLEGVEACFAAPVGDTYENLNNYSAVLRLVYGNNSFLFTGDAEEESEQEMLLASNRSLQADILKVGHHGSASSTSNAFLNTVAPKYAVIMCETDNDYGHPHKETIEKLNQRGIKIYRTDQDGNIAITSDGNTIKIKTFKDLLADQEAEPAAPVDPNNDENTCYIGNKNSKKFHCAECTSLPEEHNRIYFNTRKEAVEAGYSPCSICQP